MKSELVYKKNLSMQILKSHRKTLTIKIDKNGEVIVKTPYLTSQKIILDFIERHKIWVEKRQKEVI
ncbi:MAG: M48 family metallopeptidase [Candidatus Peribacteria bacterium]|nr:M48 family metallopeptidase [Candidatus Peribacteria bacterium]